MQEASSHQGTLQLEDLSPREVNGRVGSRSLRRDRNAIEFGRPQSAQMNPKSRVLVSKFYCNLLNYAR